MFRATCSPFSVFLILLSILLATSDLMSDGGHASGAAGAWAPPPSTVSISEAQLPRKPNSGTQNVMDKQLCFCPVCPPEPAAGHYSAQRRHFKAHFTQKHPDYTFLDSAAAAAKGSKSLNSFFAPKGENILKLMYFVIF